MDQTETGEKNRPLSKAATPLLHASQFVLAIVVLGLDAYGIQHIKYNVLIYSLVVALCTILLNVYCFLSLNVSQQQLAVPPSASFQTREQSTEGKEDARRMKYKSYVILGLYICMFIFWVVDLGLVASLAMIWGEPGCTYNFWDGYQCASYGKRHVYRRGTTSYGTYYGALVAGACLAAVQVVLWVVTIAILLRSMVRTHRLNKIPKPSLNTNQPVIETQDAGDQWGGAVPTVRTEPQPLLDSPEPGYEPHTFFKNMQQSHPQYAMP